MPDILRAWKDPSYRASLTAEQRNGLPSNPAGPSWIELEDEDLQHVVGGNFSGTVRDDIDPPFSIAQGPLCTVIMICP